MYSKLTLEKYAEVLWWGLTHARGRAFKKSSLIQVRYDIPAIPLAEAVVRLLHEQDMIPIPRAGLTPDMERDFYRLANNKRLTFPIPGEEELAMGLHGRISIIAPERLDHLSDVDPEAITIATKGRQYLQRIAHERENAGEFTWTLGYYPTRSLADQASMNLEDYARQIELGCMLDRGTPVTDWKLLAREVEEIKAWLGALDIRTLRVQSEDVDLLIPLGELRKWQGVTGRNIPSFEVYVSPDWRGVEGEYRATLPSFRQGNRVDDLRLSFRQGEVVSFSSATAQDFVRQQLATDVGSRRMGEFALVDRRFSRIGRFMANTLYDENHGGENGSCHIALGQAYANCFHGDPGLLTPEAMHKLGFNESSIHWDMICTQPVRVTARCGDGGRTVIFENGSFCP